MGVQHREPRRIDSRRDAAHAPRARGVIITHTSHDARKRLDPHGQLSGRVAVREKRGAVAQQRERGGGQRRGGEGRREEGRRQRDALHVRVAQRQRDARVPERQPERRRRAERAVGRVVPAQPAQHRRQHRPRQRGQRRVARAHAAVQLQACDGRDARAARREARWAEVVMRACFSYISGARWGWRGKHDLRIFRRGFCSGTVRGGLGEEGGAGRYRYVDLSPFYCFSVGERRCSNSPARLGTIN